jgi:pentose-5-phosphate-3-epimerase
MKLVNLIHEGSIDEKKFKKISNMSMHKKTDNVQTAINAAQSLGCNIVSIHAEDIMEKKYVISAIFFRNC